MSDGRKRSRASAGGGGGSSRVRLARYLSAQEAAQFPRARYGTMHPLRGTVENVARFGASGRSASAAQKAERQILGYSGRGKYSVGKFARDFKTVTGALGTRNYTKGLADMGMSKASAMMNRGLYTGTGLYSGSGLYNGSGKYMESNNLLAGGSGASPATIISSGDETAAVTITHREYVQDVYAPGTAGSPPVAFANTPFSLNPGLQSTFVFLSQIAQNYEEYEFIQLYYEYRSTTTDIGNSTNGQCGTCIMSTNYNAGSAPFTDKQSMLEYAHSHSCKLTESMQHFIECDPTKSALGGAMFVRTNPVVVGQDIKTYDHGIFQLAIANCPTSYNGFPVGELWVNYTVTLRKPKLYVSRGLEIDQDIFVGRTDGPAMTAFNPMGVSINEIYKGQQNNIGTLLVLPGSPSYITPPGNVGVGELEIVFPAYYTGALRIHLNYIAERPQVLRPQLAFGFGQIVGNITRLLDVGAAFYGAWNSQKRAPVSGDYQITQEIRNQISYTSYFDVFVSQATNGVNNVLSLVNATDESDPPVPNDDVFQGQGFITISQIQSYGATTSTQNPVLVNVSGVVVTL